MNDTCPCGLGPSADACCGPVIEGTRAPETPEALMRARYSAYVLEKPEFIRTSNHPDTRDEVDLEATTQWSKNADWQGLEIVETVGGAAGEDEGVVEFIARYEFNGGAHSHHERAVFQRLDGVWHYLDGEMVKPKPIVREGPKIGRNDPCPCGSGKKHKKCCAA